MKTPRRLTRAESQEATRRRLIAAAEKAFIRHGFDASSVEAIAEDAGFSRGAFYSNFRSKDDLFLEVLKAKGQEIDGALQEIASREPDPAARLRAVLDWYVNQELSPGWLVLETEFTLRALRSRPARSGLAQFNQQRISAYAALVARYLEETGAESPASPEVIAAALFAAARGACELALLEPAAEAQYAACRDLIFQRLMPPGTSSNAAADRSRVSPDRDAGGVFVPARKGGRSGAGPDPSGPRPAVRGPVRRGGQRVRGVAGESQ